MQNIWNERYRTEEFVYGTAPNTFLAEKLKGITPGSILLSAEGEGRNAVYCAREGWTTTAFDSSSTGRDKALKLAQNYNVTIDYELGSFEEIHYPDNSFDALAIIYNHMPMKQAKTTFSKLFRTVKSSGVVIIEVFSKKQLNNSSGGPKDIDLLFDLEFFELFRDLFTYFELSNETVTLNEGPLHQGIADVIRLFATK